MPNNNSDYEKEMSDFFQSEAGKMFSNQLSQMRDKLVLELLNINIMTNQIVAYETQVKIEIIQDIVDLMREISEGV